MKTLSLMEECKPKEWHTIQQIAYTILIPLQWFHNFNEGRGERDRTQNKNKNNS